MMSFLSSLEMWRWRSRAAFEHAEEIGCAIPSEPAPHRFQNEKTIWNRKSEATFMKSSTHDKAEGRTKEAVGKVKEETGKAIGNQDLQERGAAEKVGGKLQRKVGDVKKVFEK